MTASRKAFNCPDVERNMDRHQGCAPEQAGVERQLSDTSKALRDVLTWKGILNNRRKTGFKLNRIEETLSAHRHPFNSKN